MTIIHLLAIDSSIIYLHPLHICFINNGMIIVDVGSALQRLTASFIQGPNASVDTHSNIQIYHWFRLSSRT